MAAHLVPVDDGWHEWRDPAPGAIGGDVVVRVRLAEGADGRLHLVELHVAGAVSAGTLRAIPVGRIEAAANALFHPSAPDRAPRRPPAAAIPSGLRGVSAAGYPDAFYSAVAAAYRQLAATSPRPVVDLAGANEVPVTTAQRWVKESRRRGLLAPGRPGKAG